MAERHNLFEFPHKSFRFMWMEVVSVAGTTNAGDDASLEQLEAKVDFAVDAYAHHNHDESSWFAPRLAEIDKDLAARWIHDHDEHEHVLHSLRERAHAIRAERDGAARSAKLRDFYRFACRFLADDLDHMALEQEAIMTAFQNAYTDDQLRQLEGQFVAERIDPAYMKTLTPLFLRACNIDERTLLLSLVQKQSPSPEAFQGLLNGLVASIVPAGELAQIRGRLGVV